MEQSRKKEIIAAYKQKEVTGGVYAIACIPADRIWIKGDLDLQGAANRFNFAVTINSCVLPKMQADWSAHGPKAFTFEVLEEMKKKETQTLAEFRQDVATLEELWREKYDPKKLY